MLTSRLKAVRETENKWIERSLWVIDRRLARLKRVWTVEVRLEDGTQKTKHLINYLSWFSGMLIELDDPCGYLSHISGHFLGREWIRNLNEPWPLSIIHWLDKIAIRIWHQQLDNWQWKQWCELWAGRKWPIHNEFNENIADKIEHKKNRKKHQQLEMGFLRDFFKIWNTNRFSCERVKKNTLMRTVFFSRLALFV